MHYHRKDNNSGYPDSGQIDVFKTLLDYKEVNESFIFVDDKTFEKPVLIFNKSGGDLQ